MSSLKAIFYGRDTPLNSVYYLRALSRLHMISTLEPGFKGTFSLVLHLEPETASILQAVVQVLGKRVEGRLYQSSHHLQL